MITVEVSKCARHDLFGFAACLAWPSVAQRRRFGSPKRKPARRGGGGAWPEVDRRLSARRGPSLRASRPIAGHEEDKADYEKASWIT